MSFQFFSRKIMPKSAEMGSSYSATFAVFFILLQFYSSSSAMPLCTDSTAPFTPNPQLKFCPYNGTSCCNVTDDSLLRKNFESMNIPDPSCASLVKSILCSRCDRFSADLYRAEDPVPRQFPVLCSNSTASGDFCSQVWKTCQNVSIVNSPFASSSKAQIRSNSSSKLSDLWPSKYDFCSSLGGSSACFSGEPVALTDAVTPSPPPPSGMCLEKIGNGSYLNMAPHPDGSNRAFFASQQGKIWLAAVPQPGSGGLLQLDESSPFLDLSDEVYFDAEFGMLGLAFHPNFAKNGRFFVSYNCDKAKSPNCAGRCACNSDAGCDPSKLSPDNGAQPCQYNSVVAEYTVNGTASSSSPSSAARANPSEVRRIFTMGLPFTLHHGGQILFGPRDGYLYFMMGDGGGAGDPYNFAQNKRSLLGKIMRLDVDNIPSGNEISQQNLWGNYSIPKDNAFTVDKGLQKEIWASGLRNPWRCSFDSTRPEYFLCADVGQDAYEEVNLISKAGNYGWRVYEGPFLYNPPKSMGSFNTSPSSINAIFPVMGYNHSEINTNEGSASITGGYFYRSSSDPCMYGRYLFADLYAGSIWAGEENPVNSGNFTSQKISFTCARDSPLNCTYTTSSVPALSYIFSFGEDNSKDVYLLTNSGVYRIVRPSRCGYACAKDSGSGSAPRGPSPPRNGGSREGSGGIFLVLVSVLCLLRFW